MAEKQAVVTIEIHRGKGQIEVITRRKGQGRHIHYPALGQAPPELRGEALELIRTALRNAGYDSFAELDTAMTSELVVPEKEEAATEEAEAEG
jgi:hypothetical protein